MTGWLPGVRAVKGVEEAMGHKARLLDAVENNRTKVLYRAVFSEDSREFVEYYYHYKTRENRIYAVEDVDGEIVSMLHLNPYLMKQGAQEVLGEYIVAVATDERYRHQGMMRRLLKESLEDMRRMGEPFAFLMPAAEAIYRPFDFRFVYSQNRGSIAVRDYAGKPHLVCRAAEKKDMEELSEFANPYLQRNQNTFAFHTAEYFGTLLEEQRCQNGNVVLMLEQDRIRGYFFTALENEAEVREPVAQEGYEEFLLPSIAEYFKNYEQVKLYGFPEGILELGDKKPMIMARITNPEWFAPGLTAAEPVGFFLELIDEFLPENSGVYRFFADGTGGSMKKCAGRKADFSISIGEFTALAFGSLSPREAGLPEDIAAAWGSIRTCAPVFLNEVV